MTMHTYETERCRIRGDLQGTISIDQPVTSGTAANTAQYGADISAADLLAWLRQAGYVVVPAEVAEQWVTRLTMVQQRGFVLLPGDRQLYDALAAEVAAKRGEV